MDRRKLLLWAGVTLIGVGVAAGVRIPFFYLRSYLEGRHLTSVASKLITNHGADGPGTSNQSGGEVGNQFSSTAGSQSTSQTAPASMPQMIGTVPLALPQDHALFGLLEIPRLQLKAPVVEGTDDAVLNVAIGHLGSSSMPGQPGLSVLAAHNATWFRHIDKLQVGDSISVLLKNGVYHYTVTGQEVVHTGASLPNSAASVLILESCYPLDALYLTPERYLIIAKLTNVSPPAGIQSSSSPANVAYTSYLSNALNQLQVRAKVPSDLAATGLLLHQNALPLGTIRYTGPVSSAFTQSAVPLEITNTMVQLFEAYLHAASLKRPNDLISLYPAGSNVAGTADPLFGVPLSGVTFVQPLSFQLGMATGDKLQSVTAETTLLVSGQHVVCRFTAQPVEHAGATVSTVWIHLTSVSFVSRKSGP